MLACGAACSGRDGGNATQPPPLTVAIVEVTPSTDTLDNGIVMAGNAVAWYDAAHDSVAYYLTTDREVPVTHLPSWQWLPHLSARYLVWEDYRNGSADIDLARLEDVFKR